MIVLFYEMLPEEGRSKFMRQVIALIFVSLLSCGLLSSCSKASVQRDVGADDDGHTAPTEHTLEFQAQVEQKLNLENQDDFQDANRGLVARAEQVIVKDSLGKVVWDLGQYDFINGKAPGSVNPSLWRQATLNNIHGLFKVTDGVYQVRGYDLSNLTIIEGKTGWIIVDTLTATETAKAAMDLARKHLDNEDGKKPIKAIIYTHSHIDHFGGVLGVISSEQAQADGVRIIAPHGFTEEATSENILVGLAMGRRATMMYGKHLSRSKRGHVGSGLGKSPAYGTFTFLEPTEIIDQTPQTLEIDGLKFVFQFAPESEAPAELTFYLPEKKAFCGAELVSRNMHNLYTLRGAKVRDALKWSGYIHEVRGLFPETEVYFASHHWPMWGREEIDLFLERQADNYKYIHDQSVRMINEGYNGAEIAERMNIPEVLSQQFYNRGYYGTVKHNSKAVYQNYMGWYDANPANLNPLPASDSAKRYVKLMGGADKLLAAAQADFDKGDYRWVAEILNKLVFAEPANVSAKELLAKTYDQLGYQAESGPWRDVYLSAAKELREGKPDEQLDPSLMAGILQEAPSEYFMDAISVNLNGDAAAGANYVFNFTLTDTDENFVFRIRNGVFHYAKNKPVEGANATIQISRTLFLEVITKKAEGTDLFGDEFQVEGSKIDLLRFLAMLKKPDGNFNVVTP